MSPTKIPPYGTPEYRLYRTARRYGMTVHQLNKMLEDQGFKCKLCDSNLPFGSRFNVDHDPTCCSNSARQSTCGKCNRGILCHSCNIMVGHIEVAYKKELMTKIIEYISTGGKLYD